MNLNWLREFVDLASSLNFTQTAKRFHMTQPALSKHIAALEAELGVNLVDRQANAIKLTPIGRAFREDAWKIVSDMDASFERIERLKRERAYAYKVQTYSEHAFLNDVFRMTRHELARSHPLVQLDLAAIKQADQFGPLLSGESDMLVFPSAEPVEHPKLESVALFEDPLVAVVPNTSPLAANAALKAEDLNNQRVSAPDNPGEHSYLAAIQYLFESHGYNGEIESVPWERIDDLYEFSFTNGAFISAAGMVAGAMPRLLHSRYSVIPFSDNSLALTVRVYWLRGADDHPRDWILQQIQASMRAALELDDEDSAYGQPGISPIIAI